MLRRANARAETHQSLYSSHIQGLVPVKGPLVALADVRSMTVVLLLLIHCLWVFVLFFVLLCISLCHFYFCSHLDEEERVGCINFDYLPDIL